MHTHTHMHTHMHTHTCTHTHIQHTHIQHTHTHTLSHHKGHSVCCALGWTGSPGWLCCDGSSCLTCYCIVGMPVLSIIIGRSCHKYHFCCDKSSVATTKHIVSHNKSMLAATTKIVTKKKNRNRIMFVVTTYFCHDKTFVATNCVCRCKHVFVMSKIILVAAPANDSWLPPTSSQHPMMLML